MPRSTRSPRSLLCDGGGLSTAAVAAAPAGRRAAGACGASRASRRRGRSRPSASAALARARSGAGSVPLGAGRVAERRYGRIAIVRGGPPHRTRCARSRSRCRAETPYGDDLVHCALAAADDALDAALAPALVLRAPRVGERLPGARRTIARMLLEARVPHSERARYPVVAAHGEPVALPGIAVAAASAPTDWTRAHTRRHVNGSPADPDGVLEGVLISEDELRARVNELGEQVSRDYEGLDPLLVAVLKGAVIFAGDLLRAITIPCSIDFMAISSYGSGTESSGVVRILKDLDAPIAGRHVLVVEDIVDSGLTLSYLLGSLASRGPASLEICALLAKPDRREVDVACRYVGFEIPNRFVVGYGLDAEEHFRGLPVRGNGGRGAHRSVDAFERSRARGCGAGARLQSGAKRP